MFRDSESEQNLDVRMHRHDSHVGVIGVSRLGGNRPALVRVIVSR